MNHAARTALILFARGPQPGLVKTRLAAALGAVEAARLYALLLGRSLALLARWPGPRVLACVDPASLAYFRDLPQAQGCTLRLQAGEDLGARMANALTLALTEAPQALLMGSDLLDAQFEDLEAAAAWLALEVDVVLGPVADGGYWLLGLHRPQPDLLNDMRWSTPSVMQDTCMRCQSLGLRWRALPLRHDLDRPTDLAGFETLLGAAPTLPLMSGGD